MRILGEFCLLAAFVGSGYAACACVLGGWRGHRGIARSGYFAALASSVSIVVVMLILAAALLTNDFRYDYVVHYSSQRLPWHYRLAAIWVGQAGSLLLWAAILGGLAIFYRCFATVAERFDDTALGMLEGYVCFLLAVNVFAADPMKRSLVEPQNGAGLSPLLQHPSMLIHPPIVFLGYAAWAVPCALAMAALLLGRVDTWLPTARRWSLLAWTILGAGILLGANWAYEELGWGGYWGWDPVENGSLLPWLTGTACIHCQMAWSHRGMLKKTAMLLAIGTFGLCNFATFLTRSGIFSSVHAFSQSPIGWMFLALMAMLIVGGMTLVVRNRKSLEADRKLCSFWSREAVIIISTVLLLLLATTVMLGTLWLPISDYVRGLKSVLGPAFYNNSLVPIGLALLTGTAAAPLLRWGKPPDSGQSNALAISGVMGLLIAGAAAAYGVRSLISLIVAFLAAFTVAAVTGALILQVRRLNPEQPWRAVLPVLRGNRRQYLGYVIHLGFVCVAMGVTGSSLGTRRYDATMNEGDTIQWAGRRIQYARLVQRELPDMLVAEVELQVADGGRNAYTLRPARHFHLLQNEWTTEVAIHSTWGSDFYTILHTGEGGGTVTLTFVENPLMRWIWLGGWIMGTACLVTLWPGFSRRPRNDQSISVVFRSAKERPFAERKATMR